MTSPRRTFRTLCAAALLGTLAALVAPSAGAQTGDDVELRPVALDRGADPATPYLDGTRVVDGDVVVRVRGRAPLLVGSAGDGYLVYVYLDDRLRLVRVAPDVPQRVLLTKAPAQVLVSDDGATLAVIDTYRRRLTVDVRSAVDGRLLASRDGLRGYPTILDVDDDHVVLASFERGARDWSWRTDTIELLTRKSAYEADLTTDRLAYFTADPYLDGCSVVTTISRPRTTLWRSCREAVLSFSPDGERIVTTGKLVDGIGPNKVVQRTVTGTRLASYGARAYFGQVTWESPTVLLLETYSRDRGATVRCSQSLCERASDLRPTPGF